MSGAFTIPAETAGLRNDLDQWEFYIVKTRVIDRLLGNQRQISLPGLVRIGALKCPYGEIKVIVDKLSSEICSDRK